MHNYQFEIKKYRADTGHLTVEEHGIYRWLLDELYHTELPLSEEPDFYARKMRLAVGQLPSLENLLIEFFIPSDDGWTHKTVNAELERIYGRSMQAKVAADIRWARHNKKKNKRKKTNGAASSKDASAMRTHSEGNADGMPLTTHYSLPITQDKSIVEPKPDHALDIFTHWKKTMNHPRAAFDDKRKALIRKQLKNYSPEDLINAIDGCAQTPHNMGDNDRSERYDSIELILRDANHIDRFMKNNITPPGGGNKPTRPTKEYDAAGHEVIQ